MRFTLFSARPAPAGAWPGTRIVQFGGWERFSIALWEATAGRRVAAELDRIHRSDPFDLVELHAIGAGPFVTRWAKKRGVPVLAVCHSLRFFSTPEHGHRWEVARYYRWANRRTFREADRVLAVSGAIRKELVEFGVPESKICVLHTAAPAAAPGSAPDRDSSRCEFVFIGRTSRDKGLDVLVDAVARLAGEPGVRSFRLNVIGQLAEDSPIRRRARGVASNSIPGITAESRRPGLDGCGGRCGRSLPLRSLPRRLRRGLIEGALIVASQTGGIVEIIEHDRTGLLVPPEDAVALAGALKEVATGPEKYAATRQRAREAGKEQLWTARGPQLLDLYLELTSTRPRMASSPDRPA